MPTCRRSDCLPADEKREWAATAYFTLAEYRALKDHVGAHDIKMAIFLRDAAREKMDREKRA